MDYQHLLDQHERLTDVAQELCSACETLARHSNGQRGHVIPAPSAYELLGHLKVALWSLQEVVAFMPTGLANSLTAPDITVVDRDFTTGEIRDARASLAEASAALESMRCALSQVAELAEEAQGAINGQGYELSRRGSRPTSDRATSTTCKLGPNDERRGAASEFSAGAKSQS